MSGATRYVVERIPDIGARSTIYDGPALSVYTFYAISTYVTYRVTACNASGVCGTAGTTLVRILPAGGGGIEP